MDVVIVLFQGHVFLFGSHFFEFFLVFLDFAQLHFCKFSQILFGWPYEAVMDFYFPDSPHIGVFSQLRFQIKKYGQQQLLFGVDHLLIKTKTLNFRKVNVCFFGSDVIRWESNDWLVFLIVQSVENDCSFRRPNYNLLLDRLKLPVYARLGLPLELHNVLLMVFD